MNILCTITSYPPAIGGAQTHTHELMRRLNGRHRVEVAAFWNRNRSDWLLGTTLAAPQRAHTYVVDGVRVNTLTLDTRSRLAMLPWVCSYYALKGRAIREIAGHLERRLTPLAQGCDLVYNARIGREGLSVASLQVARRRGVPFVFVPYHHPRWVGWNYRHYLDLYREADGVMALTQIERQTLIDLGVRADRIFVTGNAPVLAEPAAPGGFNRRFAPNPDAPGPLVLFLAQKYRYKGLAVLRAAAALVWQRHPSAWFAFVGPRTRYSRRLFRRNDDPRIVEIGAVTLQEKTNALADCAVLCVPSSQESFGGVFTEAWSLGKPVIGGPAPALAEVIDHGIDGYITPQDAPVLAAQINRLLDRPDLRADMGEAGYHKVQQRFTWEVLVAKTEIACQNIVTGGRVPDDR